MTTIVLELHVQPGAKRTEIAGMHGTRLKIRVAAPASDGRANAALVEFLAERYGVPKRNVSIERGAASRQKKVAITGVKKP
jgi:uncharacterized protein